MGSRDVPSVQDEEAVTEILIRPDKVKERHRAQKHDGVALQRVASGQSSLTRGDRVGLFTNRRLSYPGHWNT